MKNYFLIAFLIISLSGFPNTKPGYYRFPAIYKNIIVFTAEGDLWTVSIKGGTANRLTTHHGLESHPSISPDGTTIAFSAQYEGPAEVYTIPISGGIPVRRTFGGENATVAGWTADGKILYSTRKYSTLPNNQLVTVDLKSGKEEVLPLAQADEGTFTSSGETLFFTRLPFQGSYTKRYKGGTVQNIWKYTSGSEEAMPLTNDYPGTSKSPMYYEGRIYFLTDRDGTMNIWSMDEDGDNLVQHTFHKGWDISNPELSTGVIVYQLVADIYLYDIEESTSTKIDIMLSSDFDQMREKWVKKPMDYLTSARISPSGDGIVFTARGQVFFAPSEKGRLVRITRKEGVRYRNAAFMPDGKHIVVLSDETGEYEFWKFPSNGTGEGKIITNDGNVLRWQGIPSPDGKWLAYTDKNYRIWILNIETGSPSKIDESEVGNFSDLKWSPDSKWLAYVAAADNRYSQIKLYNVETGRFIFLTSDRVDSYDPAWSLDGKWLYFLSDRHFRNSVSSPWGPRQPEPFYNNTTKVYMVSLVPGERSPFQPADELFMTTKNEEDENDDESIGQNINEGKDRSKTGKRQSMPEIRIDREGIQFRVIEVPVKPGNFYNLTVNDTHLFWMDQDASRNRNLMALKIDNKDPEPKTIVENLTGYELSLDGKKIMVQKSSDIYIIDAKGDAPKNLNEQKVDLSNWSFSLNPREEWRQMFLEAWRLERDYFYDTTLHDIDYNGLLEKHLPLVERVSDRYELSDLISHLVGELSALHIFVRGGDLRQAPDDIGVGSLGARLVRDEAKGGYRVEHIIRTDPDYPDVRSPLAHPDVNVKEGDVIKEINGVSVLSLVDPSVLLRNQVNRQVLLHAVSATTGESFHVIVKPVSAREEADLRYHEWEYERRLIVEKQGKGDLGYVHLRAMGGNNYSEWVKNFYPVYNRKGLIIDVRHNRGGNIDSWILEKLLRKAWFYWKPRIGQPTWNMQYAFRGHIVVLINERTASDGEAFAEGFRRLDLGELIGTRTWGGEIWLSSSNFLVDRGIATAAETGVYGPEGEWLIEGHGVDPDIVVDNLPHETFKGKDAQLERAIEYLQEKIEREPVDVPEHPRYPDKSLRY